MNVTAFNAGKINLGSLMVITIGAGGIWGYSQYRKNQVMVNKTFGRVEAMKSRETANQLKEQEHASSQPVSNTGSDVTLPSAHISEPLDQVSVLQREKDRLLKRARSFGITAPCEFELQSVEKAVGDDSMQRAEEALQRCRDVVFGGTAFCEDRQAALGECFRENRKLNLSKDVCNRQKNRLSLCVQAATDIINTRELAKQSFWLKSS